MKQTTRSWLWTSAALVLSLPTAYFIISAMLKFELNVPGPFDAVAPLLNRMGLDEDFGWSINLLILFGPVAALLLSVLQVLKIRWEQENDNFSIHVSIRKLRFPILVVLFSSGLLAFLFVFMVGENCAC